MAHARHRKFNTKDTYPEQKLDNDLAQAVVARGTTIFLRGQCPQDLDSAANIGSHDPVEQTHKVISNIRQLIEECGGRMEHLCKVVVYLTDHAGTKIPSAGAAGTATLLGASGKATATLQPDGENRLKGVAKYASAPDMKVVLSITLPGKPAEQARFTPFASKPAAPAKH